MIPVSVKPAGLYSITLCGRLKYLKSGGGWCLRVGIRYPSSLIKYLSLPMPT
jgi:hypothetical protein